MSANIYSFMPTIKSDTMAQKTHNINKKMYYDIILDHYFSLGLNYIIQEFGSHINSFWPIKYIEVANLFPMLLPQDKKRLKVKI